jgi:hypothetical protein
MRKRDYYGRVPHPPEGDEASLGVAAFVVAYLDRKRRGKFQVTTNETMGRIRSRKASRKKTAACVSLFSGARGPLPVPGQPLIVLPVRAALPWQYTDKMDPQLIYIPQHQPIDTTVPCAWQSAISNQPRKQRSRAM